MSLPTIPVDQIHPHPDNARVDLGDLTELAQSIRAVGLLQPIVVVQVRNGWRVIDGHRRLAAAKLAGARSLPCLATKPGDVDHDTALMLAAAMHKALEPIERARAFTKLRASGLSVAEIARRTGYGASTVSGGLLLAQLPEEAQDKVATRELTVAQATDLARQVRSNAGGEVVHHVPRAQKPKWLSKTHRLAAEVARSCGHREMRAVVGGVGCGQCWEHAIRFDEKTKGATR